MAVRLEGRWSSFLPAFTAITRTDLSVRLEVFRNIAKDCSSSTKSTVRYCMHSLWTFPLAYCTGIILLSRMHARTHAFLGVLLLVEQNFASSRNMHWMLEETHTWGIWRLKSIKSYSPCRLFLQQSETRKLPSWSIEVQGDYKLWVAVRYNKSYYSSDGGGQKL